MLYIGCACLTEKGAVEGVFAWAHLLSSCRLSVLTVNLTDTKPKKPLAPSQFPVTMDVILTRERDLSWLAPTPDGGWYAAASPSKLDALLAGGREAVEKFVALLLLGQADLVLVVYNPAMRHIHDAAVATCDVVFPFYGKGPATGENAVAELPKYKVPGRLSLPGMRKWGGTRYFNPHDPTMTVQLFGALLASRPCF